MSVSELVIARIKRMISSGDFLMRNRVGCRDFTRDRKMPFCSLILFLLNLIKQTLQKELTSFIQEFGKHTHISKSAFCQSRMKLKAEAFVELNNELITAFYGNGEYKKWNDFRLVSIDGSTLELPRSVEIIKEFGVNSPENNIPIGKISVCFDLLNEIILDSTIAPNTSSEYNLALTHLRTLHAKNLLLLDRGYNARWLFLLLIKKNIDFVIRIRKGFAKEIDEFWESKEQSTIIEMHEQSKKAETQLDNFGISLEPFKIRLVKVLLDNNETEVLATSLLDDKKYPNEIFGKLYHTRWGVEVNYHHLKNHIETGNFTGYSVQAIKQDYNASILIANIQNLIIQDAQQKINITTATRKYKYKTNRNLSIGYLKDRIVNILTSNKPNYYQEIVDLFQIEPVPIREGRTFPHNPKKYTRKWYMNQRRAL